MTSVIMIIIDNFKKHERHIYIYLFVSFTKLHAKTGMQKRITQCSI